MAEIRVAKVLLVEGERELREFLAEHLAGERIVVAEDVYQTTVDVAVNALDALEMIRASVFDAIIADLTMPEINGLDFLRTLRESGSEVPMIMLIPHGEKKVFVEALRLGCHAFLVKPCQVETVRRVMTAVVRTGVAARGKKADKGATSIRGVPEPRQRQLQSVFNSYDIARTGSHRSDFVLLPDRKSA